MTFHVHQPTSRILLLTLVGLVVYIARPAAAEQRFPDAPEWVNDQVIYEVNLRQFSKEGTVEGLQKQLPRLKALGVGILWVMPVNPIGMQGRSGTLGSPYAVRDYAQFSSEFGSLEQFKAMIAEAHRLGLHVILDWVANHSAMDCSWVSEHPDWYKHDAAGQLVHPLPEWKDVAAFNYENAGLHKAMIEAMSFWVRDVGVDGFRCDTAEWVPLDFWCEARDALRTIKPVFLLAEGNKQELMKYAFDSVYAWDFLTNAEAIAKGTKSATDFYNFIQADQRVVPTGRYRLYYTSNHDKNSWEGTTREQLADAETAFTVLSFTLPGLPQIYNGQEAGPAAEHRLSFFERDPIVWKEDPQADLYRELAALRHDHPTLWVGKRVAPATFIGSTSGPILVFKREHAQDRVIVMVNLSSGVATSKAPAEAAKMRPFLGTPFKADAKGITTLQPWQSQIWVAENEMPSNGR